jgi:hypothetical protein
MTASASWRGATLPVCGSSLETATISPGASHWPPRRSLLCRRAHAGLAVFDLIRGHRPTAAVLCAFDLIELDGEDLRREPIETRKSTLRSLLRGKHAGIAFNAHFIADGAIVYRQACALGCEGIVSKRLGSLYRSGRADCWLKVKNPAAPAVTREAEEEWN